MTKTLKMSLVTAVALAGLTTTASAGALSYSGSAAYTMEKTGGATDAAKEAQHDIDYSVSIKGKASDTVTASVRVVESSDDDNDDGSKNASATGVTIDRMMLTHKENGLTVNVGLMALPLTDSRGDGITFSKNLGGVSLGGGYMYNMSMNGADGDDMLFLTAAGKADVVSYKLAYGKVSDAGGINETDAASHLALGVSANLSAVKIGFDYTSLTGRTTGLEDQSQMKLSVSGTAGKVGYSVAYAKNGEDGGETLFDGSDVAASNISMGATNLAGDAPADGASAIHLAVSTALTASISGKLQYAAITEDDAATEEKTTRLTITKKISSNFKAWFEYETYAESASENELTLGAKYSF